MLKVCIYHSVQPVFTFCFGGTGNKGKKCPDFHTGPKISELPYGMVTGFCMSSLFDLETHLVQSSVFAINTDLSVKFLVSTQGFFISIRWGKILIKTEFTFYSCDARKFDERRDLRY